MRAVAIAFPLLATAGCALRADFVPKTHERLSVVSDPDRPGRWVGAQGRAVIDEESFYRIAGDADAVVRYQRHREAGRRERQAGTGLVSVGVPVAIQGGLFVGLGAGLRADEFAGGGVALLGFGVAATVIGAVLVHFGKHKALEPNLRLIDDPARMREGAERYNRTLR